MLVGAGQTLRVGRHERADLVIPHDDALSGLHFEIAWDGARAMVRDLDSARGTWIEGERAAAGEVGHRSFVRAGNTFFSFHVERAIPPLVEEEEDTPPAPIERRREALSALGAEDAPLFSVMDAARSPRILRILSASAEESRSLYEGPEGEDLVEVAPWISALPPGSPLLERLVLEGWGRGWGIFLTSRRPLREVRRHLRRLLEVEEKETGDTLYFRFYDPKALEAVLSICTLRQRQLVFGEVLSFLVEGSDGTLLRLRP
jgi:hypothetical protein